MEVAPSDYRKVDPDEPYRYSCPKCGTVSVYRLDKKNTKSDPYFNFYCNRCTEKLVSVIDNKKGVKVTGGRKDER